MAVRPAITFCWISSAHPNDDLWALSWLSQRARSRIEQYLENMVAGGWLEFGSLLQELPLCKGPVTGHIVMMKNPVVYFCWMVSPVSAAYFCSLKRNLMLSALKLRHCNEHWQHCFHSTADWGIWSYLNLFQHAPQISQSAYLYELDSPHSMVYLFYVHIVTW